MTHPVTLTAPVSIGGLPGRVEVTVDDENGDATRASVDLFGDYHQDGGDPDTHEAHLGARGTWETTALADALELAAQMLRTGQTASQQMHATTRSQNPPSDLDGGALVAQLLGGHTIDVTEDPTP